MPVMVCGGDGRLGSGSVTPLVFSFLHDFLILHKKKESVITFKNKGIRLPPVRYASSPGGQKQNRGGPGETGLTSARTRAVRCPRWPVAMATGGIAVAIRHLPNEGLNKNNSTAATCSCGLYHPREPTLAVAPIRGGVDALHTSTRT